MKKILCVLLTVASFGAQAEFFTGNMLMNMLDSAKDNERMMGMGYGSGGVRCEPESRTLLSQQRIFASGSGYGQEAAGRCTRKQALLC